MGGKVTAAATSARGGRRTACASRTGAGRRSRPPPARRTARTARPRAPAPARPRRSRRAASSGPRPSRRRGPRGRRGRAAASAAAVRSSSHEATTLPRRHTSATSGDVDVVLVVLGLAQRRDLGARLRLLRAGVGVVQDVQALGVGGHDPVLDAVVDHLHEVAGAGRAAVQVAVLGGRRRPAAPGVARRASPRRGRCDLKIGSRRSHRLRPRRRSSGRSRARARRRRRSCRRRRSGCPVGSSSCARARCRRGSRCCRRR